MRSVIHASDAIENKTHEFGESAEPRFAAVFITRDGYEFPVILSKKQVSVAEERADREPVERQRILTGYARSRLQTTTLVIGSIALSGVAGFIAGAWGV